MKKLITVLLLGLFLFTSVPLQASPTLVSLIINEDIIPGPDSIYLTVTGVYSDGSTSQIREGLGWYTSDTSIAEVSFSGRLTFKGKGGPVTITVYKSGVSAKKTVTVNPWPESIDIETQLVYSQNPYRLLVKGRFSDGETRYYGPEDNLVWTSLNPWVAWVNSQGVVTFTGEDGYVAIRAIAGNLSDTVNLTVDSESQSTAWRKGIKIKEELIYSATPQKLTLVVVMTDESEEEIANSAADWSSSNPEIATIDNEGTITFSGKPGFTTIAVSYGGYKYEKVVTVGRFLEKLSINQTLNYAQSWANRPKQLSVTASYNDGTQMQQTSGMTWLVDNKKIASITDSGLLTFTGKGGEVTVTVSGKGFNNTEVKDSVVVKIPEQEEVNPQRIYIDSNPISSQGLIKPKVYCIYDNGTVREITEQVTWRSKQPQTASVYQNIIYVSPNPGPIEIMASYQGLVDVIKGYVYKISGQKERVCQIRIKEHQVCYSFRPINLTALAMMGDGSVKTVTKDLKWKSSQPLVATVNQNGVLTFTGRVGKTTITAEGYGFRDELQLEVTPAELQPRVERLVLEGEMTSPGANQLKAVAIFNDGKIKDVTKEVVWNSSNRNVALVSAHGTVIFVAGLKPVEITADYLGQQATKVRE